jgi:hypothetical protein
VEDQAAVDREIRLRVVLDAGQVTRLLRAFPEVNRARWRAVALFSCLPVMLGLLPALDGAAPVASRVVRALVTASAVEVVLILVLPTVPWWVPRLTARRAGVGRPTQWVLSPTAALMSGEFGAATIAWNLIDAVREQDGLLLLLTSRPRRIIALPLAQLDPDAVRTIRHWVDSAVSTPSPTVLPGSPRSGGMITVIAAPLTRTQAKTAIRAGGRRTVPVVTAAFSLIAAVIIGTAVAAHQDLADSLFSAAPFVGLVALLRGMGWLLSFQLTRRQPYAGTWVFNAAGVNWPQPDGVAFTPWTQFRETMVVRGVLLLRLRYRKAYLPVSTAGISGTDLEQILSWATAAEVRVRS